MGRVNTRPISCFIHTIDERDLRRAAGVTRATRRIVDDERAEAQVEGDASLLRLGVFVERCRGERRAEAGHQGRLARVDVTQNADVHIAGDRGTCHPCVLYPALSLHGPCHRQ